MNFVLFRIESILHWLLTFMSQTIQRKNIILRVGVDDKVKAVFNQNHTKHRFAVVQIMEIPAIPLWIVTITKWHLKKPSKNARKQEIGFAQEMNFSVGCVAVREVAVTIFYYGHRLGNQVCM